MTAAIDQFTLPLGNVMINDHETNTAANGWGDQHRRRLYRNTATISGVPIRQCFKL